MERGDRPWGMGMGHGALQYLLYQDPLPGSHHRRRRASCREGKQLRVPDSAPLLPGVWPALHSGRMVASR